MEIFNCIDCIYKINKDNLLTELTKDLKDIDVVIRFIESKKYKNAFKNQIIIKLYKETINYIKGE